MWREYRTSRGGGTVDARDLKGKATASPHLFIEVSPHLSCADSFLSPAIVSEYAPAQGGAR